MGGKNFLHVLNRVTGCSEDGQLSIRALKEQERIIKRIQLYFRGLPRMTLSDR